MGNIIPFVFCALSFLSLRADAFSLSPIFGADSSPERPLMCYRGIKYFVGQEEIDDNVRCETNTLESVAGLDKYCYKFTSHTGMSDFVKRGCSVVICSGLRNLCTRLEFEGVHGVMCCCSDTSYCNGALTLTRAFSIFLPILLSVLSPFRL